MGAVVFGTKYALFLLTTSDLQSSSLLATEGIHMEEGIQSRHRPTKNELFKEPRVFD